MNAIIAFNQVYSSMCKHQFSPHRQQEGTEHLDNICVSKLPIIGLSHSLGGKLQGLFSSTDYVTQINNLPRKANIFLSFNNYGFKQASSSSSSSSPALSPSDEFDPSPNETWETIRSGYNSNRVTWTALIKFADDSIDQTMELKDCLPGDSYMEVHMIAGDHLQPNKLLIDKKFLTQLNGVVQKLISL